MSRRQRVEEGQLQLIRDIYTYCSSVLIDGGPAIRRNPIAWDVCQIVGAIAGSYRIELSPHFGGVQLLRRNKALWSRISLFVVLKRGTGAALPCDPGDDSQSWKQLNTGHALMHLQREFMRQLEEQIA